MIGKIDHIGIAVRNISEAVKPYTEVLGLHLEGVEEVQEQKVKTAFLAVGESHLELLESTDPEGPIAKFIESRGEGLHHIALGVTNINEALEDMTRKGIPLIDQKPRKGVENTDIAFLHPKGTGRVLLELVET